MSRARSAFSAMRWRWGWTPWPSAVSPVSAMPPLALEKRAAKLSLERDHGIGQGGLGYAAAAGCPREAALFADRQEVANLVHLHGPNPRIDGAELPSMLPLKCEVVHTSGIFVDRFGKADNV